MLIKKECNPDLPSLHKKNIFGENYVQSLPNKIIYMAVLASKNQ